MKSKGFVSMRRSGNQSIKSKSENQRSDSIKTQRLGRWFRAHESGNLIIASCLFGCSIALLTLLRTVRTERQHPGSMFTISISVTLLAAWLVNVAVSLHAFWITSNRSQTDSRLWILVSALSLVLLATAGLKESLVKLTEGSSSQSTKLLVCLLVSMIPLMISQLLTCLTLRAVKYDVFRRTKFTYSTTTLWQRLTFAWAAELLYMASKIRVLQIQHLPLSNRRFCAETLWRILPSPTIRRRSGFVVALYRAHRQNIQRQWTLSLSLALVSLLSQYCLYRLLQDLGLGSGPTRLERVYRALLFGLVCVMQQMIESHLLWVSSSMVEVPLRAQLSTMIFRKSLRISSRSAPLPSEDKAESIHINRCQDEDGQHDEFVMTEMGSAAKPGNAASQSHDLVNLVAIDAQRISEFASRYHVFLHISLTVAGSIGLLSFLIGWIPTLFGIAGPLILMPLNAVASGSYTQCQARLLSSRDSKLHFVREAILGIRQIKVSGREQFWRDAISKRRQDELCEQRTAFKWTVLLRFFWALSPVLLSILSLGTYTYIHGDLNAAIAFTALAICSNLEMALSLIPYGIIQTLEAMSSSRRIAAFLDSAEQLPHALHGQVMRMTDVLVAWTPTAHLDKRCARKLEILDFKFSSPGLSLIFGMRGSGKSMLLSAIIGEASILRGVLHIPRSTKTECSTSLPRRTSAIAYVGSQPWIERGTIKDTVLFGAPYDAIRYAEVLHAVALDADINGMQRGDLTDVGVQGNNLSGGQKLRLTLARALYSSASLLVIDDILGSLDARTKSHVVSHGLFGSLADNRTLILASNEPSMFLARSDCAIELLDPDAPILYTSNAECVERLRAMSPAKKSTMTSIDRRLDNDVASIDTNGDAADEEHVESGHVPWRLYSRYLYSAGRPCFWALALLVVGLSQAAFLARNFSLAAWTSPVTLTDTTSSSRSHATMTYMGFYVGASVLAAILEAAKCAVFYEGALSASANLYDKMASGILGASLQWLNGTPGGRIQNRMSADSALMDAKLPGDGHMFFSSIFGLLIVSIAGLLVSPIIFIPEVILGLLGLWYSFVYLQAARSTRRLDAVTRSPVLDLLGTCRLGLPTIRAFRKQKQYISRMGRYLDDQSRASTAFWLVYLWMDFRMGMLGAAFILIIAVYTAFADIDASLAGLVLTLALGYSTHAEEAIARYASLQLDMNAIERIVEYADLPQEDYSGRELAQDWPQSGRIIVRNLYASYDPDAPSVLKAINLDIPAGGRVGIVGRTGSGKSSLAQALLRLLPAKLGCITIDGLNIEEITLTELRSRICLVPQDPVLFTGDIRYNLDPEATSSDVALYNALHTVGLASSAPIDAEDDSSSATQGQVLRLGTAVTEAGSNLSQSQRQLICLARGLVRKCRIVILDEATSSVDKESDCIIQSRLQGVFMDSTVIVIAHRLSTVASFDLIAVMEAGRVAEYGPPQQLYKAKGAFRNLVEHSIEALELRRSLDT